MKKFYTVKALAAMFEKHENTIYIWITEDQLFPNAFKVKDGWYVPSGDVERLIRQGRQHNGEEMNGKKAANPRPGPTDGGFVKGWRR